MLLVLVSALGVAVVAGVVVAASDLSNSPFTTSASVAGWFEPPAPLCPSSRRLLLKFEPEPDPELRLLLLMFEIVSLRALPLSELPLEVPELLPTLELKPLLDPALENPELDRAPEPALLIAPTLELDPALDPEPDPDLNDVPDEPLENEPYVLTI